MPNGSGDSIIDRRYRFNHSTAFFFALVDVAVTAVEFRRRHARMTYDEDPRLWIFLEYQRKLRTFGAD
jgi:hypothetical protein